MHLTQGSRLTLQKRQLALAMALGMPITAAHAGWIGTSGGGYTSPGNWNGAVVDDQFVAAGALPGTSGDYIVNLTENRTTPGDLNIVYSNGNNFRLRTPTSTLASPTTLTLNGNLTFNPGSNGQNIELGSGNDSPLFLNLNGGTRELTIQPGFRDRRSTSQFAGSASNGSLIKLGEGEIEWRTKTASNLAGGSLTVLQGKLQLFAEDTNAGFAPNAINLGYSGGNKSGGVLVLRESAEKAPINNNTTLLNMNGGFLDLENGDTTNALTANALNLTAGRSAIINRQNNAKTLNFINFNRSNHGTLILGGGDNNPTQVGATSGSALRVLVSNDSNITSADSLIGTNTTAGTTNQKILPWATTTERRDDGFLPKSSTSPTGGFVTYSSTNGFRALNFSTEYAAFAGAANDENAMFSGGGTQTLAADKTVNSLVFHNNADAQPEPTINLNGRTLTVTSGGIANLGKTDGGDRAAHFNGGTIAFGAKTAYLWGNNNGGSLDIGSRLGGTGGVVIASGHVTLNSDNNTNLSGPVVVQGDLTLNNSVLNANTSLVLAGGNGVNYFADKDNNNWGLVLVNANNTAANLSGVGRIRTGNSSQFNLVGEGGTMSNISNTASNHVTVGATAYVSPGDPEGGVQRAGTILLSENVQGIRFNSGSVLKLDLASDTQFDQISLWSETSGLTGLTFDDGSTIEISLLDGYVPEVGDAWQIFSLINKNNSMFVNGAPVTGMASLVGVGAASGIEFGLSSTGQLSVISVPEPATCALVAAGCLGILLRRSRRMC